jgi:hypothetical protein
MKLYIKTMSPKCMFGTYYFLVFLLVNYLSHIPYIIYVIYIIIYNIIILIIYYIILLLFIQRILDVHLMQSHAPKYTPKMCIDQSSNPWSKAESSLLGCTTP